MKKLILETTAPFQGLPELVAFDEGLFEKEGLQVEWADRDKGVEKKTDTSITSQKGLDPFSSHGRLLEQGQADMYNACEWGNYCRVQDTGVGSRQLGRRGIVTYAAIVVRPDSEVYTAQQLAGKSRWRALLLRHALSGAASAGRVLAARTDQSGQGAKRLALPLRFHDER
jgi:NitT/TauT family transport system substrate-binding protein